MSNAFEVHLVTGQEDQCILVVLMRGLALDIVTAQTRDTAACIDECPSNHLSEIVDIRWYFLAAEAEYCLTA